MKALTVYQPWATLIAVEAKPWEFRFWDYNTRYPSLQGARLAVHAAARPMKHAEIVDLHERLKHDGGKGTGLIVDKALPFIARIRASMEGKGEHFDLPRAAFVAAATIGKAKRAADLFKGVVNDSDRVEHSLFAWPMIAVKPLTPALPCRGLQGFWNVPADLEREITKL